MKDIKKYTMNILDALKIDYYTVDFEKTNSANDGNIYQKKEVSDFTCDVIDTLIHETVSHYAFIYNLKHADDYMDYDILIYYFRMRFDEGKSIDECAKLEELEELFEKHDMQLFEHKTLEYINAQYRHAIIDAASITHTPGQTYIRYARHINEYHKKYKKLQADYERAIQTLNELSKGLTADDASDKTGS